MLPKYRNPTISNVNLQSVFSPLCHCSVKLYYDILLDLPLSPVPFNTMASAEVPSSRYSSPNRKMTASSSHPDPSHPAEMENDPQLAGPSTTGRLDFELR